MNSLIMYIPGIQSDAHFRIVFVPQFTIVFMKVINYSFQENGDLKMKELIEEE